MNQPLIVIKRSKWERDLERFGSPEAVRELYFIQNDAYAKVYQSHLRQCAALEAMRAALPQAHFVLRRQLPGLDVSAYPYVISLGGDNHFVYCSHFVGDRPLAGINSDPETSIGALLYFTVPVFLEALSPKVPPVFDLDEWTRISCELLGPHGEHRRTDPCTSEISIRNDYPELTSRYLLRVNGGPWEEQKSSGLLLATGTGSTGWYRNCFPPSERGPAAFVRSSPFFRFFAREVGAPPGRGKKYLSGQIDEEGVLEIVSEMDGMISVDAHPESTFPFPPAWRARFSLARERLRVIRDLR